MSEFQEAMEAIERFERMQHQMKTTKWSLYLVEPAPPQDGSPAGTDEIILRLRGGSGDLLKEIARQISRRADTMARRITELAIEGMEAEVGQAAAKASKTIALVQQYAGNAAQQGILDKVATQRSRKKVVAE